MRKAKFVVTKNEIMQGAEIIEGLFTYSLDLHKTSEAGEQVIGLGVYPSMEAMIPWKTFASDIMAQDGYSIE